MADSTLQILQDLEHNRFGFFQKVNSVGEIMTRKLMTLTLDDKLEHVVKLFRECNIHHVPIIDPDSKEVVGIVSERDLLRHVPRYLGTLMQGDKDYRALSTPIGSMMTRKPVHVGAGATVQKASTLMLDNHIDCLLVYENPAELQGIVTPRDFLKTALLYYRFCAKPNEPLTRLRLIDLDGGLLIDQIFRYGAQTVRDVMTRSVVTIASSESVAEAIERIQKHAVRHLPIVDEHGCLMGILSDRDILKGLAPGGRPGPAGQQEKAKFREALFATDTNDPVLREKVTAVMSHKLFVVAPETLFTDAMRMLVENRVSCLPVADASRHVSGIVTTTDVLRLFRVIALVASAFGQPVN